MYNDKAIFIWILFLTATSSCHRSPPLSDLISNDVDSGTDYIASNSSPHTEVGMDAFISNPENYAHMGYMDLLSPCIPGQRIWCNDYTFDGYGFGVCDQNKRWKTIILNGKIILACHSSLAKGKIPNTLKANYYYYFNPAACERSDCIVPEETDGKLPIKSTGNLCDWCFPHIPNGGCKDPGSACIVTDDYIAFCGRDCTNQECPSEYVCSDITRPGQSTIKQCVPKEKKCWELNFQP